LLAAPFTPISCLAHSSAVKMIYSSETSVDIHRTSCCHSAESTALHINRCENIKYDNFIDSMERNLQLLVGNHAFLYLNSADNGPFPKDRIW
jgi:hypothetical protein